MAAEDFAGFGELEAGQGGLEGFDYIAAAGVGEDLGGLFREPSVKGGDGFGGEVGDAAVELVLEFSGGVDEADFLAIGRDVVGVEGMETTAIIVGGFPGEDGGGRAIAE
jgi:hypothetical protein